MFVHVQIHNNKKIFWVKDMFLVYLVYSNVIENIYYTKY